MARLFLARMAYGFVKLLHIGEGELLLALVESAILVIRWRVLRYNSYRSWLLRIRRKSALFIEVEDSLLLRRGVLLRSVLCDETVEHGGLLLCVLGLDDGLHLLLLVLRVEQRRIHLGRTIVAADHQIPLALLTHVLADDLLYQVGLLALRFLNM